MKRLLVVVLIMAGVAVAGERKEVQVIDSKDDVNSYNIPERMYCGPMGGGTCISRGAETGSVHQVTVKARLGDVGILLSCTIAKNKDAHHCAMLRAGKYQMEAKGNDKAIVYAWANPLQSGDFKKATKLEYEIRGRNLDPDELQTH